MRFELFLAARYLRAKRRQAVVGVVTAISVAGVAAGVAALIIALAITNGMRRDLQDKLLGSTAHVELMRVDSDGIRNWRPLLEQLRHLPHVTAAAPGMYEEVMISRGPRAGFALIKGVIPSQERTVSNVLDSVATGSAASLDSDATTPSPQNMAVPPLVLGKDLAEQLGVQVGDQVVVTSPQGELNPVIGLVPKFQPFKVAGIFHSGFFQYDSGMAFIGLADAQRLFDEPDLLSVISFKVDNLNHAPEIGHSIEQAAGKGFMTTNWMEQNRELFRAPRARANRHIHCDRAHRHRRRAQHPHRTNHDGDGEDPRHRRNDELWSRTRPDPPHLPDGGLSHQHPRNSSWVSPGLFLRLGRRPLPLHTSVG